MSIMAKTPSGYKKIGSAYLGERPVDKVFNANGDIVYALQRELTGAPPLLFKGKEQSELLNYRIYGDIVDGESVGDRTANLFDGEYEDIQENLPIYEAIYVGDGYFTLSTTAPLNVNSAANLFLMSGDVQTGASTATTGVWSGHDGTVESVNGYITVAYRYQYSVDPRNYNTMLNAGSTALPYEPYGYKVPVTVTNGTNTETTNIYLPEPIKMVGDEAEYVDYKEQKQHRVRKNLLPNTATSQTINGVTFTVNEDGSITCNGTAKNTTEFTVHLDFLLSAGNYRLTGCPSGGGFSSYYSRAWYRSSEGLKWVYDFGSGYDYDFTLTDTTAMRCSMVIENAQVVDNITFYPMIRKADIEDDTYEPYIENTDLDVTLPALPTIKGTNTMSIDTEVQPSRMDIKGRIKTLT